MYCPSGEIGRHSGLKIRRFVNSGRTGSIPVSGTKWLTMFEKVIELNRYAVGDIDNAHECAGSIPVLGTKWLTMFEKVIELNRYAVGDIDNAHECTGSIPVLGFRTSAGNSCFDINP